MAIERPDGIGPWLWDATAELLREMERIDGEAMSQGQLEQDHEAYDLTWRREVAEIIGRHAGKCPACNGSGRRWQALYGMGSCDECRGTGRR